MKRLAFVLLALTAACGGDDGGSATADAPPGGKQDAPATQADAPPSVPATVTITGIVSQIGISGKTPLAGVTVTAFKVAGDTMITSVTSGSDGSFTISAPTNGAAVDAYLLATKSGLLDTYLYPPYPLVKDFMNIPVLMLDSSTQKTANQIAGADVPDASKGWIGAIITDAAQNPVAGATLTSTPAGQIHYNGSSGLPQAQAKVTAADGIGYDMNVTAGTVSVGATLTGSTFATHSINARAGKITLTLITP